MERQRFDALWAFVYGASLQAGADAYWAQRDEPRPFLHEEFMEEEIESMCLEDARHGRAGRRWARAAPSEVTLEDCILAAADYAGVKITPAEVEAACLRCQWKWRQWEGLSDLPCDWDALKADAESRGWVWDPIIPSKPLHEVSQWAAEIASHLREPTAA
jgi:hypothetical protein